MVFGEQEFEADACASLVPWRQLHSGVLCHVFKREFTRSSDNKVCSVLFCLFEEIAFALTPFCAIAFSRQGKTNDCVFVCVCVCVLFTLAQHLGNGSDVSLTNFNPQINVPYHEHCLNQTVTVCSQTKLCLLYSEPSPLRTL